MNAFTSTEIEFEQSPDFVKAVERRFFSRTLRGPCLILLPPGILGFFDLLHDARSIVDWFVICISIFPFAVWGTHYLATGQMRCKGAIPRVCVCVETDGFTVKADKGISTVKWPAIKAMWKFPDFILLFWDRKKRVKFSFAMPVNIISNELNQFIEGRVKEHGGEIS